MTSYDPLGGCCLRVFWLAIGNMALFLILLTISSDGRPLSSLDVVYWGMVLLIVIARYFDVRHYGGTTGDGTPATLSDWRRHTTRLVVVAGCAWLLVRLAAVWQSAS